MVSKKQVSSDQAVGEVNNVMSGGDQLRADGLDRLQTLRAVKNARLQREEARLTQKLGADHPRVTEIREQLKANANLRRDLELESKRARIEVPQVDSNTWCLHGFVRNKSLAGVPNLTVALFDETGKRLDQLSHGCTDANGYFRIRSSNLTNVRAAYLRVLSQQGSCVYADKNALQPSAGAIDYREIILSGEEVVCVPPPEPPTTPPVTLPWTVRGTVSDGGTVFFAGLKVAMADKAGKPIADLGTRTTDEKGKYEFIHPPGPFADLINPPVDLFVQVLDANQKVLATSPVLHFEPGKTQNVNFTLTPPKDVTGKTPNTTSPVTPPPALPWTVRGTVSDGGTVFFAGLKVAMADKAGKPIADLGTRTTDEKGKYEFIHPSGPFGDLINPPVDLFVQILDANQKVLATSTTLHFEPGKTQNVNFTISPPKDVTGKPPK